MFLEQVAAPAEAPNYEQEYERARALSNSGQYELAIQAYTAMLARSPKNSDVLLGRGLAYGRAQKWAESERDLLAATEAAPTYADLWLALGNLYRWTDRPGLAVTAYDRLVELRPKDPEAYLTRARAQAENGLPGRARADLETARELGGDKGRIDAALDQLPKATPLMAVAAPAPEKRAELSVAERAANPETVAASGYQWGAGFGASVTDVSRFDARWNEQSASVRRYGELGSIAFEALRAHRFGNHDSAWALDAYTRLWTGAYANIRYQRSATARLYPETAWRAEAWQGLGGGWEASLSEDQLHFASSTVKIHGASIAKYVGNFYLLLRLTSINTPTSDGTGRRLLARWYHAGDADNYVEMSLSGGRSEDALNLVAGRTQSGSASVSVVHYLTRDWGVKAGLSYARATNAGNEKSLSFSVSHRW